MNRRKFFKSLCIAAPAVALLPNRTKVIYSGEKLNLEGKEFYAPVDIVAPNAKEIRVTNSTFDCSTWPDGSVPFLNVKAPA